MKKVIIILILLAIGGGSYYYFNIKEVSKKSNSPVVSIVGNSVLTIDDIQKRIPAEYSEFITHEQNVDYVKRWIDSEILYQTAISRKIDEEPAIKKRLNKMKKDFLMTEMINRLSIQTTEISLIEIEKYYRANKNKFTRKETEVKYLHIAVKNFSEAWRVRNKITSNNFMYIAKQFSVDSLEDINNLYYISRTDVMSELSEVIFDIKIGGTTPPIKTPFGYYIVKIVDKKAPGTIRAIELVRDEIINHISSTTQKLHLDGIIANLRRKLVVDYHENLIPGKSEEVVDTTSK